MYSILKNGTVIKEFFSYDVALRFIERMRAWATGPDTFRTDNGDRFEITY